MPKNGLTNLTLDWSPQGTQGRKWTLHSLLALKFPLGSRAALLNIVEIFIGISFFRLLSLFLVSLTCFNFIFCNFLIKIRTRRRSMKYASPLKGGEEWGVCCCNCQLTKQQSSSYPSPPYLPPSLFLSPLRLSMQHVVFVSFSEGFSPLRVDNFLMKFHFVSFLRWQKVSN